MSWFDPRLSLEQPSRIHASSSHHCLSSCLWKLASIWRSWPSVGSRVSCPLDPASSAVAGEEWSSLTYSMWTLRWGGWASGRPRAPSSHWLAFWSGDDDDLGCALLWWGIFVWRSFLRKGLGKGEEILSVNSRHLNESAKMWRKILRKFLHTMNCKLIDRWKQLQITSTLREKPEREKPRERERIYYNVRGLQWIL